MSPANARVALRDAAHDPACRLPAGQLSAKRLPTGLSATDLPAAMRHPTRHLSAGLSATNLPARHLSTRRLPTGLSATDLPARQLSTRLSATKLPAR